jgi:hypothetical protein
MVRRALPILSLVVLSCANPSPPVAHDLATPPAAGPSGNQATASAPAAPANPGGTQATVIGSFLPAGSAAPPKRQAPGLTCGDLIPRDEPIAPAAGPSVVAGQMSEEAAQAKRLYDSERWSEAERALGRVVTGETGDDEGNKQLASYHLAIAIYRQGRYDEAMRSFEAMAARPSHLKHAETLLWAVKLADALPGDKRVLRLFATYDAHALDRFDNQYQRELFVRGTYWMGLDRYARARFAEASALLQRLPQAAAEYPAAQQCLQLMAQAKR